MFRFRFKFLADSYLLLFSFFLGMIGAALFFWWRYPVFPSYLFYSYGITGNKNFTEAFLIVIKQRFFQLGAGWLCGLTVYSVWLFGILTCFWSFSLGMGVIYFTLEKGLWGYFISWSGTFFPDGLLVQEKGCDCQHWLF